MVYVAMYHGVHQVLNFQDVPCFFPSDLFYHGKNIPKIKKEKFANLAELKFFKRRVDI